jgi:hypothetical protein
MKAGEEMKLNENRGGIGGSVKSRAIASGPRQQLSAA